MVVESQTHFFIAACFFVTAIGTLVGNPVVAQSSEPIDPVPLHVDLDERKVALGEKLFHDPRLSKNNEVSCASCHDLAVGGADQPQYSFGVSGKPGPVNTPTVFNVADHFTFFWDGRARTLESQIDGPIHNPDEMATDWDEVIKKLCKDEVYVNRFQQIYDALPTMENIKDAIVTFEQSLITPNAPFDQYLRGNTHALTDQEQLGYKYFKDYGCVSCHQGRAIGGNMFQVIGVVNDYFEHRGTPFTMADFGRYNVTGEEWDKHVFKVPSLRNVEVTAPYFHDGSAETLEEAVEIMAKAQLGRHLGKDEQAALVAFLKSLTGEYQGRKLNEK